MKSLIKDGNFDGLCILASINSTSNCLAESSALIFKDIKLTFQGCRSLIILVISATPSRCLHHLIRSCPMCYLSCATYSATSVLCTSELLAVNGNAAICSHLQVQCFTLHVVQRYVSLAVVLTVHNKQGLVDIGFRHSVV